MNNRRKKGGDYDGKGSKIRQRHLPTESGHENLFAPAALSPKERFQQARDNAKILVKNQEAAQIKHGVETVSTPEEAVRIIFCLRKNPMCKRCKQPPLNVLVRRRYLG